MKLESVFKTKKNLPTTKIDRNSNNGGDDNQDTEDTDHNNSNFVS